MNATNPPKPALILASASPRRKQLLTEAGYCFDVIASDLDESVFSSDGLSPAAYTMQLALAKAKKIAERYPDKWVLGSDTVVNYDGQIIGKPEDKQDAERILRMLFSNPHEVITGIALIHINQHVEITEAETTRIHPNKLSDQQLTDYLESGQWKGKAGAYGLQQIGDQFVERIEGSFTNVVGLPMERTSKLLNQHLQ